MRTRGTTWGPFLLAGSLGAGCGSYGTYVRTEQAALGRVVIYRNGIAYYERRARVDGDRLVLRVPGDKVDDFLKSLTVTDARTGQAVPVSFPSPAALLPGSGSVDMTIALPPSPMAPRPAAARELVLSYVTDSPAWKPSYRVVLGGDGAGQVRLQGWAVVDNTSGEDWQGVRVGVGSSSALAFRYDLHSIRTVQRELLRSQDTFAKAPPTGGSVFRDGNAGEEVLGELADQDIPRPAGHPDQAAPARNAQGAPRKELAHKAAHARGAGSGGAMPAATAEKTGPAQDDARLRALAESLRNRRGNILIEGYAAAGEPEERALDRANLLRNQLILHGVAPAQLQVQPRGVVPGQRPGVRLVEQALPAAVAARDAAAAAAADKDDGNPVGESHFESAGAMTVRRGSSAMVPIAGGPARGAIVYLYDAESSAGDARYAFRAVRFQNPTGSTLESGPVTVYGDGRFIGEGLTEAIPPGAAAVVPFALDRQVGVEREDGGGDRIARLLKLQRGVLTVEVQHLRRTHLKVTNRLRAPATLLVRHTVRRGFTLLKAPRLAERYGEAHLFQVDLGPGESRALDIEEATPMTRTLDLRSDVALDLVRAYLEGPAPAAGSDAALAQGLERLVKLHAEVAQARETIENLRQRGEEYRVRLEELHQQILGLKELRAGGPLMQHLEAKMKEISQRVQDNTIAVVDMKEKEMIARVRFQEGASELSLTPAGAPEKEKTAAR